MAGAWSFPLQYPLSLKMSAKTISADFPSGGRQAFAARPCMAEVSYPLRLSASARAAVDAFFTAQKGAFDSSWTMNLAGRSLSAMRFDSDEWRWVEELPGRYSADFKASGFYEPSTSPTELPLTPGGAVTRLGWGATRSYNTSRVDMDSGKRWALALRGGGLSGTPTGPLRSWSIEYRAVPEATAFSVCDLFALKRGPLESFDWVDPDGVARVVRFEGDDLSVNFAGFGSSSVSVGLVEVT